MLSTVLECYLACRVSVVVLIEWVPTCLVPDSLGQDQHTHELDLVGKINVLDVLKILSFLLKSLLKGMQQNNTPRLISVKIDSSTCHCNT